MQRIVFLAGRALPASAISLKMGSSLVVKFHQMFELEPARAFFVSQNSIERLLYLPGFVLFTELKFNFFSERAIQ